VNVYDAGDLILLELPLTVDGVPTDPTTLTLTITPPSGAVVVKQWPHTPTEVVKVSVGSFRYDYSPLVSGLFAYEWHGTGTAQADERGYFEVRPAYILDTPPRFCSIGDLQDFLQLAVTNDSGALRAIEGASAAIQNYCHQMIRAVASDVVTLRSRGQLVLILPEQPVTAVASVVENGTPLVNETDFTWSADGLLYRWSGAWRLNTSVFGTVEVTYDHGYTVIPQPVREVCIRSASRAYQSGLDSAARRGLNNMQSEQLPDYQVQYAAGSVALGASSLGASAAPFLLPSEQAMLNPYRMHP
jgi:hypothetical protein